MANNQHRFNPNAQSFTPNANAPSFVPGQAPFQMNQPQGFGYPPPQFYQQGQGQYQQGQYQQFGGNAPPQQFYGQQQFYNAQQPPPQFNQNQNPPTQTPQQQQPVLESWDDANVDEPQAKTEPKVEETAPPVEEPVRPSPPKIAETKKSATPQRESTPKQEKMDDQTEVAAPVVYKSKAVIDANRKEHVNIVFIGHVDAGKSTIGGQLMYLTGMVDKRTLEKYEREAKEKGRESWYLSWALDTNDEEREKGKTVEVGRAFFETEKKHFTILDAPGHKSFVPNMISGASQADLAVLVISARKGEFETGFDRGGQTREHAMLVKTAGVKHLVILVNKMDDPTVEWDNGRYEEIQNKLSPFLKSVGFNPKTDITYIPCSGLAGSFLKERPSAGQGDWYTGPCFLEFIDNMLPSISRDYSGPARVIVADKYGDMGTVVIGKMESGIITKGENVAVMPNKTICQVIQCWSDDVEVDQESKKQDILPGFVVCSKEAVCHVGKIFDAELLILEHNSIIAPGYSCVLHIHAAIEEVAVKRVICTIDKKTGEKKRIGFVKQNEKCILRLESQEPFCLELFKEFPQMGRFTLRDEGKTIAIGKVVKFVE
ncbi:Tr-type G domain-containing protein [Aphelenchoides bicaudatus]|nr:Tr-type G domain-containing protein [Aphelenchoides bicaudatus]